MSSQGMNLLLYNTIVSILLFSWITAVALLVGSFLSVIKTWDKWNFKRIRVYAYISVLVELIISLLESFPLYMLLTLIFLFTPSGVFNNFLNVAIFGVVVGIFLSPKFFRLFENRISEIYETQSYPTQLFLFSQQKFEILRKFVITSFSQEILVQVIAVALYAFSLEIGLSLILGILNIGQTSYLPFGLGNMLFLSLRKNHAVENVSTQALVIWIGILLLTIFAAYKIIEKKFLERPSRGDDENLNKDKCNLCFEIRYLDIVRQNSYKISLDGVIHMKPGEFAFLHGPSGSGKSVILKTVASLIPPGFTVERGEVKYPEEKNFWRNGRYLPQEPSLYLYPYMTIQRWVKLRYSIKDFSKDFFESYKSNIADKFNKDDFKDKYPFELSGGMKRVLSFMYLLKDIEGLKYKILLLDEPDTALDLIRQKQLAVLLRQKLGTPTSNISLLYVSHQIYIPFLISNNFYKLKISKINNLQGKYIREFKILKSKGNRSLNKKNYDSRGFDLSKRINICEDKNTHLGYNHGFRDKIIFENLRVKYLNNDKYILEEENTVINIEKFTFIIGENGTGKSTLIKTIFGIAPKESGDIKFEIQGVKWDLSDFFEQYKPILVLEDIENSLPPHVTIEKILKFLNGAKSIRKRWEEVFPGVKWEEGKDKKFQEFSGGERQRIILQIVIPLLKPKWLFLDEPFNRIDYETLKNIFEFWMDSMGNTKFIIITHNLIWVEKLLNHLLKKHSELSYNFHFISGKETICQVFKEIKNLITTKHGGMIGG